MKLSKTLTSPSMQPIVVLFAVFKGGDKGGGRGGIDSSEKDAGGVAAGGNIITASSNSQRDFVAGEDAVDSELELNDVGFAGEEGGV